MSQTQKIKVGILGSGNIGTDLMYKLLKRPGHMELAMVVGIDPESDGLKRARAEGIETSADGAQAFVSRPDIRIIFDATSAKAHVQTSKLLPDRKLVDMTPAATGPFVVPPVNLTAHIDANDVNMISCGGQASTALIYAVSRVAPVEYAELITATASNSVGPGTRHNIDEFTFTTADAMKAIGGAKEARAIPIINPAEPPIMMSNSVYCVMEEGFDEKAVIESIEQMIAEVQVYVPGYRLKAKPSVEVRETPWGRRPVLAILNEIQGAGDYLPPYAGNLDIMTASAWRVGDVFAHQLIQEGAVVA